MERDARYIIVGLFVTAVTIGAVAFLVWLLGTGSGAEGNRYAIHFENVNGLSEGGAVRFSGVDVGRVLDIAIDSGEAGLIEVIVGVREGLTLNANTTATLGYQGITGIAYVDLRGGSGDGPPLVPGPGQRYPVIRGERSDLDAFLEALPNWSDRLSLLIDNANALMSEENTELVTESLRSVSEISEALASRREEIASLVEDTAYLIDVAARSVAEIEALIEELGPGTMAAVESIRGASESLDSIATRVDELLARNDRELHALLDAGSEQLVALAREARAAAAEVANLARQLSDDPSSLLYEPPESGVEIEP